MNILITGSNGQLGSEIKDLAVKYKKFNFFFRDSRSLDICNRNQLDIFFVENKIHAVINCAAYTSVDKAEQNNEIAEKVNSEGVLNLVNAVAKVQGKLIHISTDYVFNGNHFLPYKESDPVSPIGVYGNTKRKGELAVVNSDIDGIVIRTSWLYSAHGNNFVKTMLRMGNEKEFLKVVFDQVGTPTYARDLADTCLKILIENKKLNTNGKIYHYSNQGVCSWYDFANIIMEIANIKCIIIPVDSKEFSSIAKRPHYSVLNKSKITKDFEVQIPYWTESLKKCILEIKNNLS
jgi:dTDP-4-dehydrorhamnose reductase